MNKEPAGLLSTAGSQTINKPWEVWEGRYPSGCKIGASLSFAAIVFNDPVIFGILASIGGDAPAIPSVGGDAHIAPFSMQ